MERNKPTKCTQGDGCGEGFKVPTQLREENLGMHAQTIRDVQNCMAHALYRGDLFDSCHNNDTEIWSLQLNERVLYESNQSHKGCLNLKQTSK